MKGLHQLIAQSHEKLQRGRVWCHSCGRSTCVDPVGALRHGWPRCCDATMSIDTAEERHELAEQLQHHARIH